MLAGRGERLWDAHLGKVRYFPGRMDPDPQFSFGDGHLRPFLTLGETAEFQHLNFCRLQQVGLCGGCDRLHGCVYCGSADGHGAVLCDALLANREFQEHGTLRPGSPGAERAVSPDDI